MAVMQASTVQFSQTVTSTVSAAGVFLPIAIQKIIDWVGPGRAQLNSRGDLVYTSKDGLRKFRIDYNNPNPHGSPHAHLEVWDPTAAKGKGDWVPFDPDNAQIYPKDVPPR